GRAGDGARAGTAGHPRRLGDHRRHDRLAAGARALRRAHRAAAAGGHAQARRHRRGLLAAPPAAALGVELRSGRAPPGGEVQRDGTMAALVALAVAAAAVAAVAALLWYMVAMPGRSWSGPPPPLDDDARRRAARLRAHVEAIGAREHNLWAKPELEAAAAYV